MRLRRDIVRVPVWSLLLSACIVTSAVCARRPTVYPPPDNPDYGRDIVNYLMSLSEEDMLKLVPTQTGIRFTDCPNCEAGRQDSGDWEWVPQKPFQIRCKGCGEIYPNNPKYPDDKAVTVPGPDGKVFRFPYYERPDGYRIFFQARVDYFRQNYMSQAAQAFARRYWLTGDEECARRAALIMYRFAETFPGWPYTYDGAFVQKIFVPWNQERIEGVPDYRVTRWYYWSYGEISPWLLEAYDLIRDWPGLKKLHGGKAIPTIEKMFELMVEHALGVKEKYGNVSGSVWRNAIAAGRIMNRPEWVRESVRRVRVFMQKHFLHDGCWREPSVNYGQGVLKRQQGVNEVLSGYVPPPDAPPEMADEIRKALTDTAVVFAAFQRAQNTARLPDGRIIPIEDCWAFRKYEPPRETASTLLPGLRLAILRRGDAPEPICTWLNDCSGQGHNQYDILSIGLYAFEKELLSDIGYTHTKLRAWTWATASHNTVVVNGVNSAPDRDHTRNHIRLFVTDRRGFHLTEADSDAAYRDMTSRYRRTLALIGEGSSDAYLIDIFQVRGGTQHDYLLHGSSDEPSTASVSGVSLRPFPGTLMNPGAVFHDPVGERDGYDKEMGLGFIRDLSSARAGDVVTVDMRLEAEPALGTRTYLFPGPDTTVFLGRSPQVRPAGEQDSELDKHWRPTFCARRSGQDLESTFVAVHEPVNGKPKVSGVNVRFDNNVAIVTVRRGPQARDYFLTALDGPASLRFETEDGLLEFDGGWGFCRVRAGRCVEAHLVGGAKLAIAGVELTDAEGWRGDVRNVSREVTPGSRGWLEVAETIPASARDAALHIEFPDGTTRAYNIARIEPIEKGSRLYLVEDPGYRVSDDAIELLSYPQRRISGTRVTWRLPAVKHFRTGPTRP